MEDGIGRILDIASRRGYECEVYGEVTSSFQVEVYRGEVESIDRSTDSGIGIRLVREGRIGHSFSSELSAGGLESAFREAEANSAGASAMDIDVLADNVEDSVAEPNAGPLTGSIDNSLKIDKVKEMEKAALGFGGSIVNTEGAGYSEIEGEVFVAGTRGFFRREKRGACSCSIAAVARKKEELRSGWYYSQSIDPALLDFESVGREASRRASSLLDCRQIETGRYMVIVDGPAFTEIVYLLMQILSAEMVVKGTSILAEKTGNMIAPDILSIVDDPFMADGCFNASFDDEGTPRRKYRIVDSGVLKGYLHNMYSARKMGVTPTANAVRETFKNLPLPGATNLFVVPGPRAQSEMMADLGEGIYIQNIMGMHTADSMSGDFSVGINGYYLKNGEKKQPVSELTLSGNILDLLAGIREIGSDLVFMGQYGAPSVIVEGLSVSGS